MKQMNLLLASALSLAVHLTHAQNNVSNKEKAMAILNSLETRDQVGPGYISDQRYIQHNLIITDNKPGFMALQKWLPEGNKVNIVRAFTDGNYVFLHVGYNLGGPMVGMDIFRFKEGKAVEHWDNLQHVPPPANPGGHSMIDGPADPKDLSKTAANKKLIRQYVRRVFVEGHREELAAYIDKDNFIEHHPGFSDGLAGLQKGLAESQAKGEPLVYTRIHLVLGQGNFCLVQGEGTFAGKQVALYDLFRIENGKIAEHWDTLEEIPAKETWKNPNGKF